MILSQVNVKAILVDTHQDINEYTDTAVSTIFSATKDSLTYPPNVDLTTEEILALQSISQTTTLKSALKKILADCSAGVIFNLLSNIDGTTDPRICPDNWVGVKLVDADYGGETEPTENFLHDEFYSTYWDWKNNQK